MIETSKVVYRNSRERAKAELASKDGRCMGMSPNRPKTNKETTGHWQLDGNRCRLQARPFFCPIHLHLIQEKLGCCSRIDKKLVKGILKGLPKSDPWKDVDIDEIVARANGVLAGQRIYHPTKKDFNTRYSD